MLLARFTERITTKQLAAIGVVVLTLALGAGLRVFLLLKYSDLWFCSDEANIGLMALRFVRDGQMSLFTPGVSYGGFLGPAVLGLVMILTGSPFVATKLTAALFFLLFCLALFGVTNRVVGRGAAILALVVVCISPMFLTQMTTRLIGPHLETLMMGTFLMWLTLFLADAEARDIETGTPLRRSRLLIFASWGLLAGFAWYTYYLAVTYFVPCSLFLGLSLLRPFSQMWRDKRACMPRLWRIGASATLGLLIGSLPYWIYVIIYRVLPPFDSAHPSSFSPVLGLRVFFMIGFPIIVGARAAWSHADLIPVISKGLVYVYLASVIWFAAAAVSDRRANHGKLLVVLHLLLYPVIFSLSSFSNFAEHPRYLIGLYSSLPIVLAWVICRTALRSKVLAAAVLIMATSASLYGSLKTTPATFNTIFCEPNEALIRFLREQKLRYFYANFWIAYRVMFESVVSVPEPPHEKALLELKGSTCFVFRAERDPASTALVNKATNPAYVAWEHEAPGFEKDLRKNGRTYMRKKIGRYSVFYGIKPPLPAPPPLK